MRRGRAEGSHVAEVVPPRDLEGGIGLARGFFRGLSREELSLEVATSQHGPRWYVRAGTGAGLHRALGRLRAAYPQARAEPLPGERPDLDPARLLGPERAVTVELGPRGGRAFPIRSDWRHESSPLAGVLAGIALQPGERVVLRLTLGSPPRGAAGAIRRRTVPASRPQQPADHGVPGPLPMASLLAVAAGGAQGWRWYTEGEWALLASGGVAFVAVALALALAYRLTCRPEPLPPGAAEQKLHAPLLSARLEVMAAGVESGRGRLREVASAAADSYRAYDDPSGGGLKPGRPRQKGLSGRGRRPLLLSSDEAAALWHLPDRSGAPSGVRRTAARRLAPQPGHAGSGARVGLTDADGAAAPVHLPAPLLHRNQLIVAKTRRGKSTLLRHIAASLMERVASGTEETALVVVDPHRDLAEAVLDAVPQGLEERTTYLDFANPDRPVGLNLLDRGLFPDRDRTTEHVVTMMNRLWPQNWGPRMEGALRASLLTLLEANRHYPRKAQFTLLDVAPLLTDRSLRERVLDQVQDPALRAWWRDNYDRAGRVLQQQTRSPVTSKIGRFTVTEASRLVFGQARSSFDPRSIVTEGGVLVVNTATGALGEGASSLVGATLLNLLGLLVEEQVALEPARRRRIVGLVDESSTLGAVDYPRMLSELGKYGASFVLVTQSLAKLDSLDRDLAPTIFANIDGLTVFGVSAEDARRLTWELGGDIEVPDLVSLDDYTCYARWWDGRTRPPAFSFRVDPPPLALPGRARAIAERSAARVGRPRDEVVREVARALSEHAPREAPGGRGGEPDGEPSAEAPRPPGAAATAGPEEDGDVPVDPPGDL